MRVAKAKDESKYLDPVFAEYGLDVYSNEYIEALRKENLDLKKKGKRIFNLIPQAGFQEKVLINEADLKIVGGRRGSGKVQPNTTKIVTPFGMRSLGDLKVGDIISDPTTGGDEKVLAIFEHPDHDFYEVEFSDGVSTRCGKEHLWQVKVDGGHWQVAPFEKIMEWIDQERDVRIPLPVPVKFDTDNDIKKRTESLSQLIGINCTPGAQKSLITSIKDKFDLERACYLVRSLGGIISYYNLGDRYNVYIVLPREGLSRRITSYNHIGKSDGRCITVDSPGALYLCDDFIVTHNTAISLIGALPYADNPDVNMYGFRRYENDVKRGIWKGAKQIFRGFATFADTSYEAKFFNGTGATMKMEHLADLSKVKDRFRGAEMPYIVIEELAEFTRDSLNVIFDLIGSNRSTTGLPSQFICTCNPVGRSNKLRWLLDYYIDPETDEAIPERSGKIRYFCRYGEDVTEIAWGNTPEEVYANPNAKKKIQSLTDNPDKEYRNFITSFTFIDGAYEDNKILQVTDTKYMNRISSGGNKSVINDIRGIWRDVEDTTSLVTDDDMQRFFSNSSQSNGIRCGGGDIAFKNDWLVLWAIDGMHIIDIEAKKGVTPETLPDIVRSFCQKNEIPFENFAFDGDGVGIILKQTEDLELQKCHAFSNRGPANDRVAYRNRKSECAGMLINALQSGTISIEESVLRKVFMEKKTPFTIQDKLMEERMILRWIEDESPRELIKKSAMKDVIGHSPDFIEALLYAIDRADNAKKKQKIRRGNWSYFG